MAALKAILKSLDGLADPIKALYRKEGEEFQLDVEGMVPKDKFDEFRDANKGLHAKVTELTETLKKYDGVDLKKWEESKALEQKVKDGELIKAGKIDELLTSRLDPILKKHAEERDADKKEKERLNGQLERVMIDQELTKIATAKGLRPEAIPDMLGRLRGEFKVVGDKVVSLDESGAQRRDDKGQVYTLEHGIDTLSKSAPHLFVPSKGGGANHQENRPGTGKTITRAEFNKLAPTAQMATAKEAQEGKVTITD